MQLTSYFVGIDMSKSKFDIVVLKNIPNNPENQSKKGKIIHKRFDNDNNGIKEFMNYLKQLSNINLVCFEATNIYHNKLERNLGDYKIPYVRLNPRHSAAYVKYLGNEIKTDKADAYALALLAQNWNKGLSTPPSMTSVNLKNLFSQYEYVIELIAKAKALQFDPDCSEECHNINKQIIEQNEIIAQSIIDTMVELVKKDAYFGNVFDILTSIKGVGDYIALSIITYLPEIGTISNRQIASLAGVAPKDDASGSRVSVSHIKSGRKKARNALYLLTLGSLKWNKQIIEFKKNNSHKPGKVTMVIIMHKLLKMMNSLVKGKREWVEDYKHTKK